jgi:hypothetical protein
MFVLITITNLFHEYPLGGLFVVAASLPPGESLKGPSLISPLAL